MQNYGYTDLDNEAQKINYKNAWNELKNKLDTANSALIAEIMHCTHPTESRRLSKRRESFEVVQKWMKGIESSLGQGSYTKDK